MSDDLLALFRQTGAFVDEHNEQCIVDEDVVTRSGRMQEILEIVRSHGGNVAAIGVIVDRSGGKQPDFGCPFVSLLEMNVETFETENLPANLAQIPAIKPGTK